jgi:hypothetical protein
MKIEGKKNEWWVVQQKRKMSNNNNENESTLIALRFWQRMVSCNHPLVVEFNDGRVVIGLLLACHEDLQQIIITTHSLQSNEHHVLISLQDVVEIRFNNAQGALLGICEFLFESPISFCHSTLKQKNK